MPLRINPVTGKLDYYPKLDDCSAPDDNTDLNASTSKHGLLLKLGGGTTNFLRADGTWNAPVGAAHTHDGDTLQLDGVNSDVGAFPFTTTGAITFNQDLIVDGGNIGITADADLLGLASGVLTVNGALVLLSNPSIIRTDTADGSDNKFIVFTGAGAHGDTRGGWIVSYGNEYAAAGYKGQIALVAGNVYASGDDGAIVMHTGGGNKRLTIAYGGDVTIAQDLIVDGGDIGITADPDLIGLANAALTVNGTLTATGIITGATHSKFGDTDIHSDRIEINTHGSGNRLAYIDFVGDDTYTDYGLRLMRWNSGVNSNSSLEHRGTGTFSIITDEAGPISINTDSTIRLTIGATGAIAIASGATLGFAVGTTINEFSTDDTLGGDSDDAVPTEQAVKAYVDAKAYPSYVKVSDVKSSGTAGGTFTSGAWQTRVINTEDNDADGICSISSNQITLVAGTYECRISAPGYRVDNHKIKLRNTTGSTDLLIGTNAFTDDAGAYASTQSFIWGKFTVAADQVLEVQHYGGDTQATNGFGNPASFGVDEVYAVAEFWKVG